MPGKDKAVRKGHKLRDEVADLGRKLGLVVKTEVKVARRIWGKARHIDVVMTQKETRKTLGIECKYQAVEGSADEKVPATIQDIAAWPIPGIVVFAGEGFEGNMKSFFLSTGKAVEFSDLEPWLRLYFGLSDEVS